MSRQFSQLPGVCIIFRDRHSGLQNCLFFDQQHLLLCHLTYIPPSGGSQTQSFLASGQLEEDDYARMWRALKYTNLNQEGKANSQVVRNPICDAENQDFDERKGQFIELLGGKL